MRDNYLFVNVPPSLDKEKHDFFDYNPELRYFDCINNLIKKVGGKLASDVMWAVYLVLDPDSKYFASQLNTRKELISKNFLNIPDFDWDIYEEVMTCYPTISMSPSKSDYYRIRSLFDTLLNEVEKSKKDKDAIQSFFNTLERTYKGLDNAETRMAKEKDKAAEVKGQDQPGKFAARKL